MPLTGRMSCGQAEITAIAGISARKITRSPGADTVGKKSSAPSAVTGMFIHRLKGEGIAGARSPIAISAMRRLSVQLS